jgi:hypothetical protein
VTCPCEKHGRCIVYLRFLRGEVDAMEYVKHVKRVVAKQLKAAA